MANAVEPTGAPASSGSNDVLLGMWLLGFAGFVDAIAFVVLQGNFVAFMSGNSTILASSAATGRWSLFGLSALLIILFFAGGVAGAALVRWGGARARRILLIVIALLVVADAILATIASPTPGAVLLAFVGGLMNSAVASNADVHVGLTYVTGTLVKSAHQLVAGIGTARPWAWLRTFRFWCVFTVGAGLGGLAFLHLGAAALWIASGIAVVACVLPHRRAESDPRLSFGRAPWRRSRERS